MKRILLLFLAFLAVACTPQTMEQELSSFLATRASEPLKNTIWEHQTGEQYNRYLWFSEADVSLFYGLVEAGELQRWSDFYSAPYAIKDGIVVTSLSYPLYGKTEYTESASVVKGDGFTIEMNGESYTYYGNDVDEIQGYYMFINVTIPP